MTFLGIPSLKCRTNWGRGRESEDANHQTATNVMADPEVWLRGPVEGVSSLLQPAAHALLQAKEEIPSILATFPDDKLWERPGGVASVGFHLKHIPGVIDRLFTYAAGEKLSTEQFARLKAEQEETGESKEDLIRALQHQVDKAVEKMRDIDPATLTDFRGVGRKQLPSTKLGMIFHAAEHSMRHMGQLLVTARILEHNGAAS